MDSTQDLYDNKPPTIFTQLCNVETGVHEPHINRGKSSSVSDSCDNPQRENMITCKDPQLQDFIDDARGLDFDIKLPPIDINIPSYIVILDKRTAFMSRFSIPTGVDTVGLTLVDIVSKGVVFKAGTHQESGDIEFRRTLTLGDAMLGKKTILFSSGSDVLIERLWREYKECSLFESIRAMGFSLVTGINFSVIKGECPVGQYLNQKKSLLSALLSSNAGSSAIPHIYCLDMYDVDLWCEYLRNNPQTTLVSMNCQLQKSQKDIDAIIKAVSTIMDRLPNVHFILTGFRLNQIYKFGHNLARIHFAEKTPVKYAQIHRKMFLDIRTMRFSDSYVHESVEDIMKHNINLRRVYVELTKEKVLSRYKIPDDVMKIIQSTFYVDAIDSLKTNSLQSQL